jgi:hypothetical protein
MSLEQDVLDLLKRTVHESNVALLAMVEGSDDTATTMDWIHFLTDMIGGLADAIVTVAAEVDRLRSS